MAHGFPGQDLSRPPPPIGMAMGNSNPFSMCGNRPPGPPPPFNMNCSNNFHNNGGAGSMFGGPPNRLPQQQPNNRAPFPSTPRPDFSRPPPPLPNRGGRKPCPWQMMSPPNPGVPPSRFPHAQNQRGGFRQQVCYQGDMFGPSGPTVNLRFRGQSQNGPTGNNLGNRGGPPNRGQRGGFRGRGRGFQGGNQGHQQPKKQKKKKERVEKPEDNAFFCETCDRGFKTEEKYKEHVNQHQKCRYDGCSYVAAPKLVDLHIRTQHRTGLAKKVWSLESEEDIRKWREERKRNFPTAENIAKKKEIMKEKAARGEFIQTKDFGKMRGRDRRGGRSQGKGGRRGGGRWRDYDRQSEEEIEHPPLIDLQEHEDSERTMLEASAKTDNNSLLDIENVRKDAGSSFNETDCSGKTQTEAEKNFELKMADKPVSGLAMLGSYGIGSSDEESSSSDEEDGEDQGSLLSSASQSDPLNAILHAKSPSSHPLPLSPATKDTSALTQSLNGGQSGDSSQSGQFVSRHNQNVMEEKKKNTQYESDADEAPQEMSSKADIGSDVDNYSDDDEAPQEISSKSKAKSSLERFKNGSETKDKSELEKSVNGNNEVNNNDDDDSRPEEVSSKSAVNTTDGCKSNEKQTQANTSNNQEGGESSKRKRNHSNRKRKTGLFHGQAGGKKAKAGPRRSYTLLEKLLAPDIRRERNKILQCVHYIVKNKFFAEPKSTS